MEILLRCLVGGDARPNHNKISPRVRNPTALEVSWVGRRKLTGFGKKLRMRASNLKSKIYKSKCIDISRNLSERTKTLVKYLSI